MKATVDPARTIAELQELRALTSDASGAQRLAFTATWAAARSWLRGKLKPLDLEIHTDAAGNLWATLEGRSPKALLIGGHLDSVPNGGWLDGCLNLLAGVEILRRLRRQFGRECPVTVRLVDWADEEGARFGRSLFGSSACSGTLDLEEVRRLTDKNGISLPQALAVCRLDFDRIKESGQELRGAAAYLELHIEQGPVLLDMDLPLAAVLGTCGVERHTLTFTGQAAHAGSTPMRLRRDPVLAAGKMSQEIYRIAEQFGGVCTIGSCTTSPGIPTSVAAQCRIILDQRHIDPAALAAMLDATRLASEQFARDGGVAVHWDRLMRIDPAPFHPALTGLCSDAILETCGATHRMPSGPLHDAAEMSRAGIPTAMMFVQSLHGISHSPLEDTRPEHLALSVRAFELLAQKTIDWIAAQPHSPH